MSEAIRILDELIASCRRQLAGDVGDRKRVLAQLDTYEKEKKLLEREKK